MKRILISKSPYNLKYNLTHPWTIITHYWREWKEILRRIACGFEAKYQLIQSVYSKKEEELLEEQFQEGMKWFVKYFTHLWD